MRAIPSTDRAAAGVRELPLDTARVCFGWLVTGPKPLALDVRAVRGLPNRVLPLDELRDRLMRRSCPKATRDAVWAELVKRARSEGATWTLACTGMALPALTSTTRWLTSRYPGDPFDVQAEVLAGFLGAVATVDIDRPQVLPRLRWAAYRAGMAALFEALDAPTPMPPGFRSTPPAPPWGHPDLVLARAVREGVLTRTEADLIGATRLEDVAVGRWAADHQVTVASAYKTRHRAERRLTDYLRQPADPADSTDPVADHVTAELSRPPTEQTSQQVVNLRSDPRTEQTKKVARAVSKRTPDSGLFQCGRSTPDRPETESSEVPRCA